MNENDHPCMKHPNKRSFYCDDCLDQYRERIKELEKEVERLNRQRAMEQGAWEQTDAHKEENAILKIKCTEQAQEIERLKADSSYWFDKHCNKSKYGVGMKEALLTIAILIFGYFVITQAHQGYKENLVWKANVQHQITYLFEEEDKLKVRK